VTAATITTWTTDAPPAVRIFRITFALLTLHYGSLGLTYLVDPGQAVRAFSSVNEALGGVAFAPPDVAPWRFATVCGVTTLAVMTALLLVDLRRNYALVWPTTWFKGLNAALWFWYSGTTDGMPVFALAGVLDVLIVTVMILVARRAHGALTASAL
jgi:hypothetical protein